MSAQRISADPDKVKAIREWPEPKAITEARSFHGVASFYRRFIKHFSSIMAPITDCPKKGSFQWTSNGALAFRDIKNRMASAPILRHPEVACDASEYGISGVLSQEGHLIAFFSEKLTESRSIKYTTYEEELYALLQSLRHWRFYLLPDEFFAIGGSTFYLINLLCIRTMKPLSTGVFNLMLTLSMRDG